eukprot:365076-Chlamydomonas_euryale.AAC.3
MPARRSNVNAGAAAAVALLALLAATAAVDARRGLTWRAEPEPTIAEAATRSAAQVTDQPTDLIKTVKAALQGAIDARAVAHPDAAARCTVLAPSEKVTAMPHSERVPLSVYYVPRASKGGLETHLCGAAAAVVAVVAAATAAAAVVVVAAISVSVVLYTP